MTTGSCCSKYSLLGGFANQTVEYVKPTSFIQPGCLTRRIHQTSYRVKKLVHPDSKALGKISTLPWLNDRDASRLNVQVQHLKPTLSYATPKWTNVFGGSISNFNSDYANSKPSRNQQPWSPLFPDVMVRYN